MRTASTVLSVMALLAIALASEASAACCGVNGVLARRAYRAQAGCGDGSRGGSYGCGDMSYGAMGYDATGCGDMGYGAMGCGDTGGSCQKDGCGCCYKTMTLTRTIFEPVREQCQRVEYDTVWDQQTVQDVKRVSSIQYRQEEFTYQRPYVEVLTREVPYTVRWPVYETRSRDISYVTYAPSYERKVRSVPYTTYHSVCETHYRTISYSVPRQVCYTRTIQVHGGHWETRTVKCPLPCQKGVSQKGASQKGAEQKGECVTCQRVWVPTVEQREITCTRTEYDICTRQVPYTTTRMIPETHQRTYEYTEVKMMPVTQVRTVNYQVARTMTEQRFRTENYTVQRSVPETGIRSVPYTVYDEVPVTRCVSTPRQVPRTVCYTVTRMVPRTVTCEVRVPVCCPKATKGKGKGTYGDQEVQGELTAPDLSPEAAAPAEAETAKALPKTERLLTPVSTTAAVDSREHRRHFAAGLDSYWHGDFEQAIVELRAASEAAPRDAKYRFFLALALHQAGQLEEADRTLAIAVALEREAPVAGLGRALERVQGEPRLWLEAARRQEVTEA